MPNIKGNTRLTKKSRHSGIMRALRNRRQLSKLQDHHSTFTHRSQHQGKSRSQLEGSQLKGPTRSQLKRTTRNQLKVAIMSQFCNLEGNTRRLALQKVIHGGRGVWKCFASEALAPEQRRAPKALFSASNNNIIII